MRYRKPSRESDDAQSADARPSRAIADAASSYRPSSRSPKRAASSAAMLLFSMIREFLSTRGGARRRVAFRRAPLFARCYRAVRTRREPPLPYMAGARPHARAE